MKTNYLSDATKILILVASVIIVCIMCAVGFKMVNEGKSAVNASTNNLNSMTSQYQDVDIAIYDGADVQGSEVTNFIKKVMNGDKYLSVVVKTKANTAGTHYNYTYSSITNTLTAQTSSPNELSETKSDTTYINSFAQFSGKAFKDINGIIIAVEFDQK